MKQLAPVLFLFSTCFANSTFYIKGAGTITYANWESNLTNLNISSDSWSKGKRQPGFDLAVGTFSYKGLYGSPAAIVAEAGVKRIDKVVFQIYDNQPIRERIYTTVPYAALGISQAYENYRATFMVGVGKRILDIDNKILARYNWGVSSYITPVFSASIDRSIIKGTGFGLGYQIIPGRAYLIGSNSTSREFVPLLQQGQLLFYYHI